LENIFKKSVAGNTTLLVVEQFLGDNPSTHIADLQMYLVTSGGRERTYNHFKNLLRSGGKNDPTLAKVASLILDHSGFKIYDVAQTRSPFNVIEARATKALVQYVGDQDMVVNMDLEK